MRAVVQRVSSARVLAGGQVTGKINRGFLVLLGVEEGDTRLDAGYLAGKIGGLRVFEDSQGKMNLDLAQTKGEVLVVSQFTLLGDCRKGKRPSFDAAAGPQEAKELYEEFCRLLEDQGLEVARGVFQARMQVELVNDGPVTLLLDSRRLF